MKLATVFLVSAVAAELCISAPIARADAQRAGVKTLKGLAGVQVVVEDVAPDLTASGIKASDIQLSVEALLNAAGIKVYDEDEWKADSAHPYLYIRINSVKTADTSLFAYSLDVELHQTVNLVQNSDVTTLASTWETGSFGLVPVASVRRICDAVNLDVGEFVTDYNEQNSTGNSAYHTLMEPRRDRVATR